jgi:hypothetical protein
MEPLVGVRGTPVENLKEKVSTFPGGRTEHSREEKKTREFGLAYKLRDRIIDDRLSGSPG